MIRLAIIGLGNIGGSVLRYMHKNPMPGIELVALCDCRQPDDNIAGLISVRSVPFVTEIEALTNFKPDYVLEAATQEVVQKYILFFLKRGISFITLSTGGLYDDKLYGEVKRLCSPDGPRVIIPSGAVGGLDIVRAAAMDGIESVHLKTTKPAGSIEAADGKPAQEEEQAGPIRLFSGKASDAARLFPRNINVAMVLALAGVGPERTTVEIIADPECRENTHQISVRGDFGSAQITLRNRPSPDNPQTSHLAILSVLSILNQLQIGLLPGA